MMRDHLRFCFTRFGFEIKRIGERKRYFQTLFSRIRNIKGDIVEAGVGKGKTFVILAELIHAEHSGRKLWGFDSFEGFPAPSKEDAGIRNPQQGEWNCLEEDDMPKILTATGFKKTWIDVYIRIVKGFFQDVFPRAAFPPIALLHLDCDLYASYKICLQYLFPFVARGGIIAFDEYKGEKFPGATKAIDEYFGDVHFVRDKKSGKYFFIKP